MSNRRQRRARDAEGKLPSQIYVGGTPYTVKLLLVTGRDPLGRPRECRMIHAEETVEMKDGLEFLTVFAHAGAAGGRWS